MHQSSPRGGGGYDPTMTQVRCAHRYKKYDKSKPLRKRGTQSHGSTVCGLRSPGCRNSLRRSRRALDSLSTRTGCFIEQENRTMKLKLRLCIILTLMAGM